MSDNATIDLNATIPNCDIIIGSVHIASWIFGIVDKKIFDNRLKDVKVEWSNTLKNRKAVSVKRIGPDGSSIHICLSETNLKDVTGKQLLETLVVNKNLMIVKKTQKQRRFSCHFYSLKWFTSISIKRN